MASTAAAPTALGELRPLLELVPSPLNPRKHFDKQKLEELAASITSKGIIEPLIVRERPGFGQLEIVAGERRYRAAKMAKHDLVPVIIRHLSDVEVLELMAIENSQRDDLHPLEEADGFKALMKADPSYTQKAIAAKIGKSERYVHQRLQLARLEPTVKTAFLNDTIQAGHADLISRLKPEDQIAALKACFHNLFGEDQARGCISVRALDRWIEGNIRLTLTADDPQTEFFPEVAETVAEAEKILQVAASYIPPAQMAKHLPGVLSSDAFRQVTGKADRCKFAERAVVVIGNGRGKFIEICRARTECKKHYKWEIAQADANAKQRPASSRSTSKPKISAKAKAAEQKAVEKRKTERAREELRNSVLSELPRAFGKVAPSTLTTAALNLLLFLRGAKSVRALLIAEVGELSWNRNDEADYQRLVKLFKPLGVDVLAIEQKLAPMDERLQTSAKKAAKK